MKRGRLIRISVLVLLLLFAVAGAGYGASSGSGTVTIAAAAAMDITVIASASIASTQPGQCGTTSTVVNVKSNRAYNLQIASGATYLNGKAKNGLIEMTYAFQYGTAGAGPWAYITVTYVSVFASQAKTSAVGRDHTVWYQQCVDWADDPATYTIVVEYLGVQI